ncbi:MAG: helix-turn-helix domain-containing protein [Candidatus Micrarchaeota archaeon]
MVKETLKKLGLSDAEADVYLCLLRNGPLRASEIAKKAGMYRPYVYDNLNKLMARGLASNIIIDGKKQFKAANPDTLRDYLKGKMDEVESALPELHKQMAQASQGAFVEVYKGKNAVRKAHLDILRILKENPNIEHLGLGIDEELWIKNEPSFSRWFIKQLEKNKIRERMITYENEKVFSGGKTSQYRFIPEQFFNPTMIYIDWDLVTIILWADPNVAIKIRSTELSDSYRKQFELTWKHGKRKKWKQTPIEKEKAG